MGIYAAESHDVLSGIIRRKAVNLEDVLILRRQVWPDGAISKSEAEMLFRINDVVEASCGEWDDFFVESITTFLVDQAHPEGFVSEGDAGWLERLILHDGKVCGATQLETLISVITEAKHVPHRLEMLALETIHDAVLSGDHTLLTNDALEKGAIGDPEVSLLRRVLYSSSGARGDAISLDEAELIYALNAETAETTRCVAWTTLYVNILSSYLLSQHQYIPPSRERLREVDNWLNRPSAGVIGFSEAVARRNAPVKKSGGLFADIKSAFGELSPIEDAYERRSDEAEQNHAERVDSDEARWLIDNLTRDGQLTVNERALLVFLRTGDYVLPADLERMIAIAE